MKNRLFRALGLFGILVSLYFVTYTGQFISTDEIILLDAAHSFYFYHNLDLTYSTNLRPFVTLPPDRVGASLDSEPLQAYFSAPLLWIAAHVPGIGMVQTTLLINVFLTALTAVVLYYYGVALGYTDATALTIALVFGTATIAWPYSRFYFREPLFTLMALTGAYALERWRAKIEAGHIRPDLLLLAGGALVLAFLSKEASLLVLPTLLIIAFPHFQINRRTVIELGIGLMLVLIAILIALITGIASRSLGRLQVLDLRFVWQAIPGYLISPGNSIWVFSPVLLLSFPGGYSLLRQSRLRYPLAVAVLAGTFAVGYAVLQGSNWIGGKAWGPRYMVPLTPFLCLLLLPVAGSLIERRFRVWAGALIVGIAAQSVLVQIIAVIIPLDAYPNYLNSESGLFNRLAAPIAIWNEGTWNPLYSAPVVSAHQFTAPSPLAWVVNGSAVTVLPLAGLALGLGLWLVLMNRSRRRWIAAAMLATGLGLLLYAGLRSYYGDIRYGAGNQGAWKVLDGLSAGIRPGDVVLLNDDATYLNSFMNYYKHPEPIYALPNSPGEPSIPGQPAEIETNAPDGRVSPYLPMLLARLAPRSTRWWFVTQYAPFTQGRRRVTESYLARHYYPAQEIVSQDTARLILYAPLNAPPDVIPPLPANPVRFDFGAVTLVGYDLDRTDYQQGEFIPLSLLWNKPDWPTGMEPFDYSVNVALIAADGADVAQRAGTPIGSFGLMSTWVSGGYYRDNQALAAEVPPGDYALWVSVYDWRDGHKLPVTGVGAAGDHVVLAQIHIAN